MHLLSTFTARQAILCHLHSILPFCCFPLCVICPIYRFHPFLTSILSPATHSSVLLPWCCFSFSAGSKGFGSAWFSSASYQLGSCLCRRSSCGSRKHAQKGSKEFLSQIQRCSILPVIYLLWLGSLCCAVFMK